MSETLSDRFKNFCMVHVAKVEKALPLVACLQAVLRLRANYCIFPEIHWSIFTTILVHR